MMKSPGVFGCKVYKNAWQGLWAVTGEMGICCRGKPRTK